MTAPIQHPGEPRSNDVRKLIADCEPIASRTYTPTQLVIGRSAGPFHWSVDGRRFYDYTSGVLVSNLGHNHAGWRDRFLHYLGWSETSAGTGYAEAMPLTAYNAISLVEADAVGRLVTSLRRTPGGRRCEQVLWAASGSEAVQKALWASLAFDGNRSLIVATRHGFHGKKGLAEAVTGSESDRNRDPRVRFVSFPMQEVSDLSRRGESFDPTPYRRELEAVASARERIACVITEPYLGGAGSYHPPKAYLQMLQDFCRETGAIFILDEIQANFGRTGRMYAFETYGLEPDLVVLGKGLGNGVPASCVAGRADVLGSLTYGEASDTFSGNPFSAAAVLATLDIFEQSDVLAGARASSRVIEQGLVGLKTFPFVRHVRGEDEGMVWGVEVSASGDKTANEIANACILACYRGDDTGRAVHIMGPLAQKVLRIAPPLTITVDEAADSVAAMRECFATVASEHATVR